MHLALHASDPDITPAAAQNTAHFDPLAAATELATLLSANAVERDRPAATPAHERELIRASGLLALSVPRPNSAARAPTGRRSTRGPHRRPRRQRPRPPARLPPPAAGRHPRCMACRQQRRLLTEPASSAPVLGQCPESARPAPGRHAHAGGYLLNGVKSFASGSVGSDWLTISAWDPRPAGRPDRRGADAPARRRGAGRLGCLRPAPDRQRQRPLREGRAARRPGAAGAGHRAPTRRPPALAGGAAGHDQPLPRHRRRRLGGGARAT
jgi:hypothetical protein